MPKQAIQAIAAGNASGKPEENQEGRESQDDNLVLHQESPPSQTASTLARLQNCGKVIVINDPYQSVAKN